MAQPNCSYLAQFWSVSPNPAPISCHFSLGSSALPLCAASVRAPWVSSPCALHGCAAWARCLGALPVRSLGAVPGRCLCARPLGAACGPCLCTQPEHSQPDHGIAPMITNRCVQALNAPCPKSISATCTVLSVLRPCCWPSEPISDPTSDPTCEARHALFLSGSSHGCKATHEALPHVDSLLRSLRGLQTHPHQLRSTSSST